MGPNEGYDQRRAARGVHRSLQGLVYAELARTRIEELKKQQVVVTKLPRLESSRERPFDGYWIVKGAAKSGCDSKAWQNRVPIRNFVIYFADARRGQVVADGSFAYTRANRNYPDRTVTMTGKLSAKAGSGTYASGTRKGDLTLTKE